VHRDLEAAQGDSTMTTTFMDVYREIGNLEEFQKQYRFNESHSLSLKGPVYRSWKPTDRSPNSANLSKYSTLDILNRCISITEIHSLVTVRQVYYVLVSSQDIYNNDNEYKRVVRILRNARLAGLINFESIVDDTREAEKTSSWNNTEEFLLAALRQYRSNWWRDQDYYVEVWLEKRALRRIFLPITNSYDVYLCTGGGYQSWSEIYKASERLNSNRDKKQVLLYFGDLDPSGKDMPRDIKDRLSLLGNNPVMREVALTKQDIVKYELPRNPAKKWDARNKWYKEKYCIDYAVELDALPPEVLKGKIRSAIEEYCDLPKLVRKSMKDESQKMFWQRRIEGDGTNQDIDE
jgi:hypothetical protein